MQKIVHNLLLIGLCLALTACQYRVNAYHPYDAIKARAPELVTPGLPNRYAVMDTSVYRKLKKQQLILIQKKLTLHLIMPVKANFPQKSAVVNSAFMDILDNVVKLLQRYPYSDAYVIGYTDNRGTTQQNHKIALARANAVMNYMESQGISCKRLFPIALGAAFPRANNATVEGRYINRRVELFIR